MWSKKKMRFLMLVVVLTLSTLFLNAQAEDGINPDFRESEGRLVNNNIIFESGLMRAIVIYNKPMIQYSYLYDYFNMTNFMISFKSITEYADNNNDDVFVGGVDTVVKTLDLENAGFSHGQFFDLIDQEYDINSENVTLIEKMGTGITLFKSGLIKVQEGTSVSIEDGEGTSVKFVLKMMSFNVTIEPSMGALSYQVHGGSTLKIDIDIENWPFENENNKLAVQVDLSKGSDVWSYSEKKVDQGKIEIVNSSGAVYGYFDWIDHSEVTTGDQKYQVSVNAITKIEETDSGEEMLKVYLCYPNFQGRLLHDPSIALLREHAPDEDTIAPSIQYIQNPSNKITTEEKAIIEVDVIDEYSGIDSLELKYSTDNEKTWISKNFTKIDDSYITEIEEQSSATTVDYYVVARDAAGNERVSDPLSYGITELTIDSWTPYGVALIALVILLTSYLISRRS